MHILNIFRVVEIQQQSKRSIYIILESKDSSGKELYGKNQDEQVQLWKYTSVGEQSGRRLEV